LKSTPLFDTFLSPVSDENVEKRVFRVLRRKKVRADKKNALRHPQKLFLQKNDFKVFSGNSCEKKHQKLPFGFFSTLPPWPTWGSDVGGGHDEIRPDPPWGGGHVVTPSCSKRQSGKKPKGSFWCFFSQELPEKTLKSFFCKKKSFGCLNAFFLSARTFFRRKTRNTGFSTFSSETGLKKVLKSGVLFKAG